MTRRARNLPRPAMRRRPLLALLVFIGALAPAGVALAAFHQTATTRLTAVRSGTSTGIAAYVHAADPTALGLKPRSVRRLVITFPAGTRFNFGTPLVTDCRYTDKQLRTEFGPACPRSSLIGTGVGYANAAPMLMTPLKESVNLYVTGPSTAILFVLPDLPAYEPQIMHLRVSGSTLTLLVPQVVWAKLIHVVVASLRLDVPALGSGSDALITSGRCVDGSFGVLQHFVYADPGTVDIRSSSACRS